MHYKRSLIEVLSILLGTGYSIKPNDKYENANHGTVCSLVFETPEMARLAYAIYLNTQNSFSDIIDNIKYVFRLLNINSEWTK